VGLGFLLRSTGFLQGGDGAVTLVRLPDLLHSPVGNLLYQDYLASPPSPQFLLDNPTHFTVIQLNHKPFTTTSEIFLGNEKFCYGMLLQIRITKKIVKK
jgi:hypothetical protein